MKLEGATETWAKVQALAQCSHDLGYTLKTDLGNVSDLRWNYQEH